jgi:(1->4)-alpha-D-glucan 1-alpha-D-glucosylmutase
MASPGVPDIYQGNELWNFALVDPDNRRPVDYKCRREKLASLKGAKPDELWENWPDGRIKMFLTNRLLRFRREYVDLFRRGNYLPIAASGAFADCCIGFARELEGEWIVVLAPRLTSRIGFPPIGDKWKDTAIELPEAFSVSNARDIFTGREIPFDNRQLNIRDALSVLPFAALTNCSGGL